MLIVCPFLENKFLYGKNSPLSMMCYKHIFYIVCYVLFVFVCVAMPFFLLIICSQVYYSFLLISEFRMILKKYFFISSRVDFSLKFSSSTFMVLLFYI